MNDINTSTSDAPVGDASHGGLPGLTSGKKNSKVNKLVMASVGFLAVALLVIGAVIFVRRMQLQHDESMVEKKEAAAKQHQSGGPGTAHDFGADEARIAADEKRQRDLAALANQGTGASGVGGANSPVNVPPISMSQQGGAGTPGQGAAPAHVQTVAERRLAGNVIVALGTGEGEPGAANAANGATADVQPSHAGVPAKDGLDSKLSSSKLDGVSAGFLPALDYLMTRGRMIRCAMDTTIVSTYPGMTKCNVTRDVYSANGHTLLIEKNSIVTGEQRTALMQGDARIFVIWTRIDTPLGVSMNIDSPGADALGASGQAAYVDNHFWQRFGGALMVSLVGDFGQALSNKTVGTSNNQISFSSTSSNTQNVADDALKNTINIPPTAYSNQGAEINIFVARDVNFKSVYELAQP